MAALVSVPLTCTYTDPDGTASSFGTVTAALLSPTRVKVPTSTTVLSGSKTWKIVAGALPAGCVVMAPSAGNGSITYFVTENIEGIVRTYNMTVASTNSAGIDLSTVTG